MQFYMTLHQLQSYHIYVLYACTENKYYFNGWPVRCREFDAEFTWLQKCKDMFTFLRER